MANEHKEREAQVKEWEFGLNEHSTWYWQAVDRETRVVIEQARKDFVTLFLCVKDAERHHYTLPNERDAWYGIPV